VLTADSSAASGVKWAAASGGSYWRVDASIQGAQVDLGAAAQSAYIAPDNGSLTLTNNTSTSGNVLTADITCSSTNAPTGVTCSSGNEQLGVNFDVPEDGDILACVSFSHQYDLGASSAIFAAFQIVQTADNSQTITQEGKSRVQSAASGVASLAGAHPNRLCGTFYVTTGSVTLRLMYEQFTSGTPNSNVIAADGSGSVGQRDVHWEVTPLR
jgi:hypothetical protein